MRLLILWVRLASSLAFSKSVRYAALSLSLEWYLCLSRGEVDRDLLSLEDLLRGARLGGVLGSVFTGVASSSLRLLLLVDGSGLTALDLVNFLASPYNDSSL